MLSTKDLIVIDRDHYKFDEDDIIWKEINFHIKKKRNIKNVSNFVSITNRIIFSNNKIYYIDKSKLSDISRNDYVTHKLQAKYYTKSKENFYKVSDLLNQIL